jgi:hypothetical protein
MKKIFTILIISIAMNSCTPVFRVINYSPSAKLQESKFNNEEVTSEYNFYYSDTVRNTYLRDLRNNYSLDSIVENYNTELDKIKAILDWTSKQWKHNGNNTPLKSDAQSILKEAAEGKNFRCVEYGIVASTALNSIGIPSRILSLKTRDLEKVKYGAGHVVAEVFSAELDKWIFIDPQFNLIPVIDKIPLNAVELQKAIYEKNEKLEAVKLDGNHSRGSLDNYIKWVGKYLYFFDVSFDQRIEYDKISKKIDGKSKLMLVPIGEENPTIFQRKYKIDYCAYTNFLKDFYQKPDSKF